MLPQIRGVPRKLGAGRPLFRYDGGVQRKSALLELPFATGVAEGLVERPILTVAELDRRLRRVVEGATEDLRVEGEISGLRVVGSGHSYFALKDEREEACIECVMYRQASAGARRLLRDGARVVLTGTATVYVARGRLQFVADDARLAGRGALLEALERLKQKLADEGLFDPTRKRSLPGEPRVIGVVTSASGAAIHDIIKVAFRRGRVRILLSPAAVQGAGAAARIAEALSLIDRTPGIDAVIVGRGGGSAEDLSAFNDEEVVRRVASMRMPVVSAVGHEVDVTLVDLVADARASTPSQAAEMLVPDDAARQNAIGHLETRLIRAHRQAMDECRREIERLSSALPRAQELVAERQQRLDEALTRMQSAYLRMRGARRGELHRFERRLAARHPRAVLETARTTLAPLEVRAHAAARSAIESGQRQLASLSASLEALSPLSVLSRGYAIALAPSGTALRNAHEACEGDDIRLRLWRGELEARVTRVLSATSPSTEGGAAEDTGAEVRESDG